MLINGKKLGKIREAVGVNGDHRPPQELFIYLILFLKPLIHHRSQDLRGF